MKEYSLPIYWTFERWEQEKNVMWRKI